MKKVVLLKNKVVLFLKKVVLLKNKVVLLKNKVVIIFDADNHEPDPHITTPHACTFVHTALKDTATDRIDTDISEGVSGDISCLLNPNEEDLQRRNLSTEKKNMNFQLLEWKKQYVK